VHACMHACEGWMAGNGVKDKRSATRAVLCTVGRDLHHQFDCTKFGDAARHAMGMRSSKHASKRNISL
jgi:hypothetical protein